jgi:hypothetical protein
MFGHGFPPLRTSKRLPIPCVRFLTSR